MCLYLKILFPFFKDIISETIKLSTFKDQNPSSFRHIPLTAANSETLNERELLISFGVQQITLM